MYAIVSLLLIITLSVLITRIATIALIHTGLSRESARFQARSAYTGVGFTTHEAESVVNHPVRRRIVMLLMLLGNAGIVSAMATLMLGFLGPGRGTALVYRMALLIGGIVILWLLARSPWIDRLLSKAIRWALRRWTNLDVRDYAGLLHLSGSYLVTELRVEHGDWMAGRSLGELSLRREGILVLGVQRADGSYVGAPNGSTRIFEGDVLILYGRESGCRNLDRRRADTMGDIEHEEAVAEQSQILEQQNKKQEVREK